MNAPSPRRIAVVVAVGLLLISAGAILFRRPNLTALLRSKADVREQSRSAFDESYLDAATGRVGIVRRECRECHSAPNDPARNTSGILADRAELSREAWARAISLPTTCGACHFVPDPSNLPRQGWREVISRMAQIAASRGARQLTSEEFQDVLHFYFTFSRETQPTLGDDPAPRESPLQFDPVPLGNPPGTDPRDPPFLGHVQIADLDQDGRADVLVCDSAKSVVTWIHVRDGTWKEEVLATVRHPARTQIFRRRPEGPLEIIVACLGSMGPTDDPVGSVVLLSGTGAKGFAPVTILEQVGRVAAVEPGDFDGDGDIDFVVAGYGFINRGEVGWLESESGATYRYHPIARKTGAVAALPVELNGDGRLDFIALFAQEHEEISAFLNDGTFGFREHVLFKAATPSYGSSGIQLVDLDQDGDTDVLFTNGDNLDVPTIIPRPYHGVQWLENRGKLNFVWHDLHRAYGAYCAVAGDLNNDGDLDIVVTTLFNDWGDPNRASLLWLENDGRQQFRPHSLATRPTHLIAAAVGDMDGDGWRDIVTCGMYGFPPFDRIGRVTLSRNRGGRR